MHSKFQHIIDTIGMSYYEDHKDVKGNDGVSLFQIELYSKLLIGKVLEELESLNIDLQSVSEELVNNFGFSLTETIEIPITEEDLHKRRIVKPNGAKALADYRNYLNLNKLEEGTKHAINNRIRLKLETSLAGKKKKSIARKKRLIDSISNIIYDVDFRSFESYKKITSIKRIGE